VNQARYASKLRDAHGRVVQHDSHVAESGDFEGAEWPWTLTLVTPIFLQLMKPLERAATDPK
jgi:hypothetical protein